jgi:hypothetical protein
VIHRGPVVTTPFPEVVVHGRLPKAVRLFDEDRLRWLDSPIPIGRTTSVTTYLRGINLRPDLWAEPLQFRPARHAEATPDQRQARGP